MKKQEMERMKEMEGLLICLEKKAEREAERAEARAKEGGEAKGAWASLAFGHSLKKGAYSEARRLLQGALEMGNGEWEEAKKALHFRIIS